MNPTETPRARPTSLALPDRTEPRLPPQRLVAGNVATVIAVAVKAIGVLVVLYVLPFAIAAAMMGFVLKIGRSSRRRRGLW